MRPYQIVATERILNRIEVSTNYKKTGTIEAGGYIWHTTGSGKTLTSFKTAQLATNLPYIDKVLFIVDRKDLDYQTMKEYDRFEKGAANGNTSTKVLQRQIEDPNSRIIITTIQKLDIFISQNRVHNVFKQHIVLIFDECHRSQFGNMHEKIVRAFRNYHLFGFTGTPIFSVNAGGSGNPLMRTTPQAFGDKLHTYTIVNAINDGNVLPFRIDYVNTLKMAEDIADEKVHSIDVERVLGSPERVREVVTYILDHFDQKTKRNSFYSLKGQRKAGFNAIFAVSSIPMAMRYYTEFKRQLAERNRTLRIAMIYSFSDNENEQGGTLPDEGFETDKLDRNSRDFLNSAISDYNTAFQVDYDTSAGKFQNYYKDLSDKVKNREVDLLIVVNMFLTGFDATTLNTLWVDKNLKYHGLVQAFSRTNRILNSVKTFGNIICFRNLKQETDEAISLFGDRDAGGIVLLKTFDEYYNGYEENGVHKAGYVELITMLTEFYPLGTGITGKEEKKSFIKLYGAILRMKNILSAFDEFTGKEILSERDFQDYQSMYINLYQEFRGKIADREYINDDVVFEIELVRQVEVNIDYILLLVDQYHDSNCTDKGALTEIEKAVDASIQLRSKKELIEGFISRVNTSAKVDNDWNQFVNQKKEEELSLIIAEENLRPEETQRFLTNAFRDGVLKTTGTDIDKILPPTSRFSGNRAAKKQVISDKLNQFFEKYRGVV
jgi:type I restriction enzyme R subunit